jgi:hypothetical protein
LSKAQMHQPHLSKVRACWLAEQCVSTSQVLAPLRSCQRPPPRVLPNPSLKLTRYGRRCKPGPRHLVHHREPGLQRLPPRAA